MLHRGVSLTVNSLRERFLIPELRSIVKMDHTQMEYVYIETS